MWEVFETVFGLDAEQWENVWFETFETEEEANETARTLGSDWDVREVTE